MNKRAARILILFLVFAASVGVFTHLMSHETTENATDLDAASLPVLYMKTADAERHPDLAAQYGIMQAPTLLVVEDGQAQKIVNASNIQKYVDEYLS